MVVNISKEGVRLADLDGRVVRVKEARPVYDLIRQLNKKRQGGDNDAKNERARQQS